MKMQSYCMMVIQLICVFQVNISLFILHGLWVVPLPQPLFFFQFLLQPLLPAQLLQWQPIQVRAPLPVWPSVCIVFQLVWMPLMLKQFWLWFLLLVDWSLSAHRWCALSWPKRAVRLLRTVASVEMQQSMWNWFYPPPHTFPFLIFLFQLVLLRVR